MSTEACFENLSDVTGLGVRINLYASSIIICALSGMSRASSLIEGCRANACLSIFALLITALVRTAQHELALYHAIFIFHTILFLTISIVVPGWRPPKTFRDLFTTIGIASMFLVWAIYVWAKAPSFGPQGGIPCNDRIKYIFFFASVKVTALWLRVTSIIGLAGLIVLFDFIYGLICSLIIISKNDKGKGAAESGAAEKSTPEKGAPENESMKNEPKRGVMYKLRVFMPFLFVPNCIYGIITLELYLARNKHLEIPGGDETWTFGQVVSLVMISGTLYDALPLIYTLLRHPRETAASTLELLSAPFKLISRNTKKPTTAMSLEGDSQGGAINP